MDGIVRSRRLVPQGAADTYALRILRPTGTGSYVSVATSSPVVASTTEMKTTVTNLPIRAGDLIGLDGLKVSPSFRSVSRPGLTPFWWKDPDLVEGAAAPSAVGSWEVGFNAQVEPVPRVTPVAPGSGPLAGGTAVTIAGIDLDGATSVKFGSSPASSFVVDSDLQITAIAPPATSTACKLGKVTGRRDNTAKVIKQNPKAGTLRTPSSTVSVKLG